MGNPPSEPRQPPLTSSTPFENMESSLPSSHANDNDCYGLAVKGPGYPRRNSLFCTNDLINDDDDSFSDDKTSFFDQKLNNNHHMEKSITHPSNKSTPQRFQNRFSNSSSTSTTTSYTHTSHSSLSPSTSSLLASSPPPTSLPPLQLHPPPRRRSSLSPDEQHLLHTVHTGRTLIQRRTMNTSLCTLQPPSATHLTRSISATVIEDHKARIRLTACINERSEGLLTMAELEFLNALVVSPAVSVEVLQRTVRVLTTCWLYNKREEGSMSPLRFTMGRQQRLVRRRSLLDEEEEEGCCFNEDRGEDRGEAFRTELWMMEDTHDVSADADADADADAVNDILDQEEVDQEERVLYSDCHLDCHMGQISSLLCYMGSSSTCLMKAILCRDYLLPKTPSLSLPSKHCIQEMETQDQPLPPPTPQGEEEIEDTTNSLTTHQHDDNHDDYQIPNESSFTILGTSVNDLYAQPHVLSPPIMNALRHEMPYIVQHDNFWLKYSLVRDGASMRTLLSHVRNSVRTVLAIETVEGEVFGSFTSSPWRTNSSYYGNGESFLWRLRRCRFSHCATPKDQARLENDVEFFHWTSSNRNIQQANPYKLIVGGGSPINDNNNNNKDHTDNDDDDKKECHNDDGNKVEWGFGLALNADLSCGSSSSCITFDSPALPQKGGQGGVFDVLNVEVWTMSPVETVKQAEQLELARAFIVEHSAFVEA